VARTRTTQEVNLSCEECSTQEGNVENRVPWEVRPMAPDGAHTACGIRSVRTEVKFVSFIVIQGLVVSQL
jgi:hypothetical protein